MLALARQEKQAQSVVLASPDSLVKLQVEVDGSITLLDNSPVHSPSDDIIIETTTEISLSAPVNNESEKTAKNKEKKEKAKDKSEKKAEKEIKSNKTEKKEKGSEKTDKTQDKTKKKTKKTEGKEKGEEVGLVESTHVVGVMERVEFDYKSVEKIVGVYDYFSNI